MKAVILNGLGGLDKLQYTSITSPKINSIIEAIVKVHYCGINHLDLHIRRGTRKGLEKFPHILGSEITGEIVDIQKSQKGFKIGDLVAVYPWVFCGKCQQCRETRENICDYGGTLGRTSWGGYAEYAVVPVKNLIKLPDKKLLKSACAVTLAGTTAYHLIDRSKIKEQSTVLVTGATGGVGTIVIQILKSKKCKIICSTSKKEKISLLKRLGAKQVILTNDLTALVKKYYPRGVDFVIDIMGGRVWSCALQTLKKNGTMVFCATSLEGSGEVNIAESFSKQVNILGSYGGTINDLKSVINLLGRGVIRPVIDSVFPLKEAAQAQKKMESQKAFGKILLRI